MSDMRHMNHIVQVADRDLRLIREKESTYRGSWKKRGGIGAFMMLARKMDRIESMAEEANYDIFAIIEKQGLGAADGELLAEIRDLRTYLILVEAEMVSRTFGQPLVRESTTTEHPAPFGYVEDEE